MSLEIARQIMNLEMPDRVGRTEYCAHPELVRHVTSLDPNSDDPEEARKATQAFYRWANFDFLWMNDDGPVDWAELGRTTDMGHAVYAEGGTDFRDTTVCPFRTPDEVLEFDAAEEYGLPDVEARADYFQNFHNDVQQTHPTVLVPGGYVKTLISGCIQSFGWDMFLEAVGTDPVRFGDRVLEGFFKLTLANVQAWAKTDIEVFIQHDDIVWSEGPVFNPDWYRRYVFPRYAKLWRVLKEKDIRVIFCSDGNFDEFIDDIARAGADGFIFEPLTSLDRIVEGYGTTHVIVGNADCRILTFGTKDDIAAEVKRCMTLGKPCPGFIMAVGNHIPPNVPLDNALYYFDLVEKYGRR